MPGAMHTSCTVEMVDLQQRYDVAVLDEIQVLLPAGPCSMPCMAVSRVKCCKTGAKLHMRGSLPDHSSHASMQAGL